LHRTWATEAILARRALHALTKARFPTTGSPARVSGDIGARVTVMEAVRLAVAKLVKEVRTKSRVVFMFSEV
jgi:hypothetical protein